MTANEKYTVDLGIGPEMEEGLKLLAKLDGVTDISAMDGPAITFAGRLAATLESVGTVERVDVLACSRGWYLFFVEPERANWAAAGADLEAAVVDIADPEIAAHVRTALRGAGMVAPAD